MNKLFNGDCQEVMAEFNYRTFDSIVCDPPYGLEFMGKDWDKGVPGVAYWKEALRVLKPGGYLLAFGGTRTYHRMACAIEDAGFELRDCIMWIYGSGFPKSQDVSKAIDKAAGAKRPVIGTKPGHEEFANRTTRGHLDFKDGSEGFDRPWMHDDEKRENYHVATGPTTESAKKWQGWGTALKPAYEPIILARKPLEEKRTVASNVLKYGTGALNIDASRIPVEGEIIHTPQSDPAKREGVVGTDLGISRSDVVDFQAAQRASIERTMTLGRWPANVIHDGSDEVLQTFPNAPGQIAESIEDGEPQNNSVYGKMNRSGPRIIPREEANKSAARFFYCPKAAKSERGKENNHPTVKPLALMRYLCKLVTQPNGTILDPFMGSGSTGVAAAEEGFNFYGIELDKSYFEIAQSRIQGEQNIDEHLANVENVLSEKCEFD